MSEAEPLLGTGRRCSKISCAKLARGVGTAICIVLMVVSWVTMAEKLQTVGSDYPKPFFQTYFIHSHYTLLYVLWKFWLIFPGNFSCNRVGEGKLTNFKYLAISTWFVAVMLYISDCLWFLSLTRTSLSANTAVYQSVSAIVFIISVPVLRERVTLLKISCVVLTITGVSLVSVFTQNRNPALINSTLMDVGGEEGVAWELDEVAATDAPENTTPLGYVFLAISTIFFAISEVGFKKFATKPDDPATIQNSVRGIGYVGVHTLLWGWPLLIVLHFTGLETFEWPSLNILLLLFLNALLDILFNLGLFLCIALSSPLVATVGSVLVVPASVLVDWMVHDKFLDWEAYIGITLILCGFFALVFSESWESFYWERRLNTQELEASSQSRLKLAEGPGVTATYTTVNVARKRKPFFYYII